MDNKEYQKLPCDITAPTVMLKKNSTKKSAHNAKGVP